MHLARKEPKDLRWVVENEVGEAMKGAAKPTVSGVRTSGREKGRPWARGLVSLRRGGAVKGSDWEGGGREKRRIGLMEWAWIALRILGEWGRERRWFYFLGRRQGVRGNLSLSSALLTDCHTEHCCSNEIHFGQ